MAGKKLVLMPGAYDALSARVIEAEGFEAIVAGGYAGGRLHAGAGRHGPVQHARLCEPLRPHLRRGRNPGLCRCRHRLRRRQQRAADGARVRGGGRRRACSSATRCSRTAAAICPASRSCRSSRCWPRSRPRSTRGAIPTCSSPPAPTRPASRVVEEAIARCQLFMEAGADMAKPMGFDTIPEIKRAMREIPGPHMATLSQAAGPKARSLSELEAAGVCSATFPSIALFAAANAVRNVLRAAQAERLAGALPGASHPARRLLQSRRPEGSAGARGELRQGGRGAGAEARGGIGRGACDVALRIGRPSPRLFVVALPAARRRKAPRSSTRAASSRSSSATRSATTTTSARGCWRDTVQGNCPASRPSSCRTCRRRPAWSAANYMAT